MYRNAPSIINLIFFFFSSYLFSFPLLSKKMASNSLHVFMQAFSLIMSLYIRLLDTKLMSIIFDGHFIQSCEIYRNNSLTYLNLLETQPSFTIDQNNILKHYTSETLTILNNILKFSKEMRYITNINVGPSE